jgi:ferritin-like metal-binding protein YciE
MSNQSPKKVLQRYLEDVIASEKSFESQLRTRATEGDYAPAKQFFASHASETESQHERLTARLEQLGGSASSVKTAMAHVFNFAPKVAQIGHAASGKSFAEYHHGLYHRE